MIPQDEDSCSRTGIPSHLISEREPKTTGLAGASMYVCKHPKCDPPFVAQGGNAPLFMHICRAHLGICLTCPYCTGKFYYAHSGWREHMRKKHSGVPWYSSQIQSDEAAQAEDLLQQVERDPTALSSAAQCYDEALDSSVPPGE